jgi:hypothetical protein
MPTTVNLEVRFKVKGNFADHYRRVMPDTVRSILLFVLAAILEIGGAWLIWQGLREHRGLAWVGIGALALARYGVWR